MGDMLATRSISLKAADELPNPSVQAMDNKARPAKEHPTSKKRVGIKRSSKRPRLMPKRALSSYNIFFQEHLKTMSPEEKTPEADGDKPFTKVAKIVAQRWKELTPAEMEKYKQLAEEDSQRYVREMKRYQEQVSRDQKAVHDTSEKHSAKPKEETDFLSSTKGQNSVPEGQVRTPISEAPETLNVVDHADITNFVLPLNAMCALERHPFAPPPPLQPCGGASPWDLALLNTARHHHQQQSSSGSLLFATGAQQNHLNKAAAIRFALEHGGSAMQLQLQLQDLYSPNYTMAMAQQQAGVLGYAGAAQQVQAALGERGEAAAAATTVLFPQQNQWSRGGVAAEAFQQGILRNLFS